MPSLSKQRKRLGLVEPAKISADLSSFKMADVSMKKVKDLMAKKDAIEREIKEFQEVLDSVSLSSSILKFLFALDFSKTWYNLVCLQQKGVGMHEKLIDDENYPRSDIDVYTVRVARNRIICKNYFIPFWKFFSWSQLNISIHADVMLNVG